MGSGLRFTRFVGRALCAVDLIIYGHRQWCVSDGIEIEIEIWTDSDQRDTQYELLDTGYYWWLEVLKNSIPFSSTKVNRPRLAMLGSHPRTWYLRDYNSLGWVVSNKKFTAFCIC